MIVPFWEDVFKDDKAFLFGNSPNKTILEYEKLFSKEWNILDVGCGDECDVKIVQMVCER